MGSSINNKAFPLDNFAQGREIEICSLFSAGLEKFKKKILYMYIPKALELITAGHSCKHMRRRQGQHAFEKSSERSCLQNDTLEMVSATSSFHCLVDMKVKLVTLYLSGIYFDSGHTIINEKNTVPMLTGIGVQEW